MFYRQTCGSPLHKNFLCHYDNQITTIIVGDEFKVIHCKITRSRYVIRVGCYENDDKIVVYSKIFTYFLDSKTVYYNTIVLYNKLK